MSKNKYSNKSLIITFGIIIGAIFLFLYFNSWNKVREQEKYQDSYLMQTNTINLEMLDINEINNVLSETPNYYFVYISYTKDKDIYNLEKELKPLIDDYNLQNNFYYINVTDIKENNKNYKKELAKELNIKENYVNEIPVILYFKNSTLIDSVTNAKDFETLLKEQNIKAL